MMRTSWASINARPRLTTSSRIRSSSVSPPIARAIAAVASQPAHGALELLASGGHVAIEPGVLDRDRRPVGQDDDGLLVVGRERLAADLLGEVQVPPRLAANEDRDAEEGAHRRVPRREAVGARMLADVVQAQRARVVDEHAEQAATARQVADGAVDRPRRCRA